MTNCVPLVRNPFSHAGSQNPSVICQRCSFIVVILQTMNHSRGIRNLAQIVVAILVEVFDHVWVKFGEVRFVQKLDCDDHILHGRDCIL